VHQFCKLRHSDVGPVLDGLDQEALKRCQPSTRRPPLTRGLKRTGFQVPFHQLDDETRRNIKFGRRGSAGVTRLNEGHDTTSKIQR
jgi:hypothetical protein